MTRVTVTRSRTAQRHGVRDILLPLAVSALLLTGCGGGGNGGPTGASRAPVIANLVPLAGSGPCDPIPPGFSVVFLGYSFDYADADGDVRGGHVEVGGGATGTFPVPSTRVSITGTTSGKITVLECEIAKGAVTVSRFRRVTLVDAAGNRSNELAATL